MMSHFVELHLIGSNNQPIILNTDWIAYLKPFDKGTIIYLGTIDVSGQQEVLRSGLNTLRVLEDYLTLKELLRCK